MSILHTTDTRSNHNDQLVNLARAIGRSAQKRAIFAAVYKGKKAIKTVDEIVAATKLDAKTVLTLGNELVNNQLFTKAKGPNGRMAYKKDGWTGQHKDKILAYAQDRKKRDAVPTKVNPGGSRSATMATAVKRVAAAKPWFKAKVITVDDVESFSRVAKVKDAGDLPQSVSENTFKLGVQAIIKEHGTFNDWGGEQNDLFTTRVKIDGKRIPAAFQFKGPGKQGPLVPGKLGKNGDQIQRLFATAARIFFVQYWSSIKESVLEQMQAFAIMKSITTRETIYYGVMDGSDSYRLLRAYPQSFKAKGSARRQAKKRKRR